MPPDEVSVRPFQECRTMHSLIRRFALLAVTVGALAAFPGAASAATCNHDGDGPHQDNDPSLVDAGGFFWDVGTTGMVDDGYHDSSERSDAFDLFGGLLASADNGQTFHEYQNPDANSCVVSQNGHQLDYPEDTTTILTLGMSRSVYVAPNGLPFLRYVDTLRNFT